MGFNISGLVINKSYKNNMPELLLIQDTEADNMSDNSNKPEP